MNSKLGQLLESKTGKTTINVCEQPVVCWCGRPGDHSTMFTRERSQIVFLLSLYDNAQGVSHLLPTSYARTREKRQFFLSANHFSRTLLMKKLFSFAIVTTKN
jgi:hypothetical protein